MRSANWHIALVCAIVLSVACGGSEGSSDTGAGPKGSTSAISPTSTTKPALGRSTPATTIPASGNLSAVPAATRPLATPDSAPLPLETSDETLAYATRATPLGVQLRNGKDGMLGRVIRVEQLRLGESRQRSEWASQDLSLRDEPDDPVWEVEIDSVWIGHSCMIGAPPEHCHWEHIVYVIHAETGDIVGLRYPDR